MEAYEGWMLFPTPSPSPRKQDWVSHVSLGILITGN